MTKKEYLENYRLRDRDFVDEEIFVNLSQAACFGPNARFIGCKISISSKSSQVSFSESLFQDCVLHFTRRLSKENFEDAQFVKCRFLGTLADCDFGARNGNDSNDIKNRVLDCDFTEADLRLCRFFNTDITRIQFPLWPNFTILDYKEAAEDFRSSHFSNAVAYSKMLLNVRQHGEVALCCHASDESKEIGCTVEELRAFVRGKTYVVT